MGHRAGDQILELLDKSIRENIGENNLCVRYGGDEFLLLITNEEDDKKVSKNINKIKSAFQNGICTSMQEAACTFSVGISVCPIGMTLEGGIIYNADIALYNAKK